ncbi:MAG: putative collagen-binding domain-containing protein, partial [Pseudomonadota bacterium]
PAPKGLTPDNTDELRKTVLYPIYFSGGNIEWYFGYHRLPLGGDMRTEDFRTREDMYRYTRIARHMMQDELPFWAMQPADDLYSGNTSAEVFAQTGNVYAVYLADASDTGTLTVEPGQYTLRWFNPRNGEYTGDTQSILAEDTIALGAAPADANEDWVVLVKLYSDESEPAEPTEGTDTDNGNGNGDTTDEEEQPDSEEPAAKDASTGSLGLSVGLLAILLVLRRLRSANRWYQTT